MNNVLLWVGGLMIAALALLFAVPYFIDWNSYRGVFEEEVSRVLGRDVRVGGRVDLRLLPKPFVRFEKIRISDVGAMQGEPFFRAESFTLWLSVPPLLRGAFEAHDVEIEKPILSLAFDEQGAGNWRSFQINSSALAFLPTEVALQSVHITDGSVLLRDIASRTSASVTGIDGEFAATALGGPYRFRGDAVFNGERHEIRLGTSPLEADGRLRLKLGIRAADSQNSYSLDGAFSEIAGRPRLDGSLTARMPLMPMAGTIPADAARTAPVVFELKSQIEADAAGAKLTDLTLGYEQNGQPQLLSGGLTATWGASRSTSIDLASRWLDLDRITGGGRPLDAVRDLAGRLAVLMPQDGTSRASIRVDQVNFGGEPVSDVNMALVRRDGVLELEDLGGSVPGNGRLSVQGRFAPATASKAPAPFTGAVMLRGASLARFLTWAFPGQEIVAAGRPDSPFSLTGTLALAGDRVGFSNATFETATVRLGGRADLRDGDAPELSIAVEGDAIDLSALSPDLVRLDAWRRIIAGEPVAAGAGLLERRAGAGVLKLDVRTGRLTDGVTTLLDVTADITASRTRLDIPVLRLRSREGLALDVTAALQSFEDQRDGTVTGWISAPGPEATAQLAALLPASVSVAITPAGLGQIGPLEIGFTAVAQKGASRRFTVKADGSAAGSPFAVAAVLDGGPSGWRQAPIEIMATVESADIGALATRLGGRASPADAGGKPAPGKAVVKLAGPSAESLVALIQIGSAEQSISFEGRAHLPQDAGVVDLDGEVQIRTPDLGAALALIDPQIRLLARGLSAEGGLGFTRTGRVVRLTPRRLTVAGAGLSGDVTLTQEPGLTTVGGRLAMARGALTELAGGLLDRRPRPGSDSSGLPSIWPEAAFDFSALEGIDGQIVLAVAQLEMADGLILSDASMDLVLAPGKLSIPRLEGRALDGTASGRLSLERVAGGAELTLSGRLGAVPLAAVLGGPAKGQGNALLELEAKGRAASLRGLASAISGSGRIVLEGARLPGLAPTIIDTVADALIETAGAPSRAEIEAEVRRALVQTSLAIGDRDLALTLADGVLRVAAFEAPAESGKARNATTVDLSTFKADSEWTLVSTRRKAGLGGELPSISLVWVGALKEIAGLQPKLGVEALERELAVRRMEREVDRLEQLRRQDEERARQERLQREPVLPAPGSTVRDDGTTIVVPLPIPGQAAPVETAVPPGPTVSAPARRTPRAEGPRPRSLEEILEAK